jgi:cob(I)alamin adenosyltransferase
MAMERGYVQVYTGDGKGKTTAALGLALRAAGAGMRVFIAQFAKGQSSSELASLALLVPRIEVHRYGTGLFITDAPTPGDIAAASAGLAAAREAILSGAWDMIVLDEANIAAWLGLFSVDELLGLVDLAGGRMEIVITGRRADPRVIERADLVTEMREVRHYFSRGVPARVGIET